jgi:hypothetical protein
MEAKVSYQSFRLEIRLEIRRIVISGPEVWYNILFRFHVQSPAASYYGRGQFSTTLNYHVGGGGEGGSCLI